MFILCIANKIQQIDARNTIPIVKHGGESVMVWVYIDASGVEKLVFFDGIMDKMAYLNILNIFEK